MELNQFSYFLCMVIMSFFFRSLHVSLSNTGKSYEQCEVCVDYRDNGLQIQLLELTLLYTLQLVGCCGDFPPQGVGQSILMTSEIRKWSV